MPVFSSSSFPVPRFRFSRSGGPPRNVPPKERSSGNDISDLVDLVEVFTTTHGTPDQVLLAGPSEGGIVTVLALEKHPEYIEAKVVERLVEPEHRLLEP